MHGLPKSGHLPLLSFLRGTPIVSRGSRGLGVHSGWENTVNSLALVGQVIVILCGGQRCSVGRVLS